MPVPLLDLHPQMDPLRQEILKEFEEILDTCQFILGPKVDAFEKAIADYCGVSYAVGVSSGTDALLLTLMSLDIGPGDLVLTTDYSFFATAGVIARCHATPVFLDIDPQTYNICPQKLSEKLASMSAEERASVKAIMPVHLYGQCADMEAILAIGQQYQIPVIEDAAQAIGSETKLGGNTKRAGSMGLAGCFSFFPSKNLGGIGDAGVVTTNDENFYQILKRNRVHGASQVYLHETVGGNFRIDPIQAAAIQIKLRHLDSWHAQRQTNAKNYNRLFEEAGLTQVQTPLVVHNDLDHGHIYNQYKIRTPQRDELQAFLKQHQIGSAVYYPVPFHQQPCFKDVPANESYPESEKAAKEVLALPVYPGLTLDMQKEVVRTIAAFYQQ